MTERAAAPKVVVTGGPGAGKTTLLDALSHKGYTIVADTAREIIRTRLSRGLSPRPEPERFAREILEIDIRQYGQATSDGTTILFERGIVDALGMLNHLGLLSADERNRHLETYPYHQNVLVLPPWREIYRTDSERDQTFDESVVVHDQICRWYVRCGYALVEVPRLPVEDRCTFVSNLLESIPNADFHIE